MDVLFTRLDNNSEESINFLLIDVQILQSLIQFCILEETRNNFKSPFVNCDLENECEKLCKVFLQKLGEKIPDFLDFLQNKQSNEHIINTTWKEKVTIFGLEKLKILELLTAVLKFKDEKLLMKMLEIDVFQKFFVMIIIYLNLS